MQVLRRIRMVHKRGRRDELRRIRLPWGLYLDFPDGHVSGSALARTGVYDLCVTEALFRLAEPGEVAVDVGANIGYMTSVLAARVGPAGEVLAVEPNPEPLALLRCNVERWSSQDGIGSLAIREAALTDRSGITRLHVPDEHEWSSLIAPGGASDARVLDVQAERLDEIVDQDVGVLKIDAEGAEFEVLCGAGGLLEKGRIRDVVFEAQQPYPTDVTLYLETLGFSIFVLSQELFGLRVNAAGDRSAFSWDPPSYLATIDPDRALRLLRKRGWAVFGLGGLSRRLRT